MPRFAISAVFEVGPGKVPRGADVLERMRVSGRATHRFSYCDGRTLTVVVDWTAPTADVARAEAVTGVRLVWSQLAGVDPGEPLHVRVRSLTPAVAVRVSAGLRRLTSWHPEGLPEIELDLLLRHPDHPDHPDRPDEDPGDGGLAGVREPRRPKPGPGQLSAALDVPRQVL